MPNLPGQIPADRFADPAEGKRYGMLAAPERRAKNERALERDLHSAFSGSLHRLDIEFRHTDPTRKTTDGPGWPDYEIYLKNGRAYFIEFKVGANTLTPEQEKKIARLRELGHPVDIFHDYETAIRAVRRLFDL